MAKYVCNKCGECCKNFEVFVGDDPSNISKRGLIEKFVVEELGIGFNRIDNVSVKVYGPCSYLNEEKNTCRIHKNEPVRCREFYCRRSKEQWRKAKKK